MAIQWFPGHMNKARKDMASTMGKVDLVIELLDARVPGASTNPLILDLRRHRQRPSIKIINKCDLADAQITKLWAKELQTGPDVAVITASNDTKADTVRRIREAARRLAPHRTGVEKPLRVMIVGVPNVGKSTLMNALSQRKIAQVADTPGVTKSQQRIELVDGMIVIDTPGLMWPKIGYETDGYRLALTGAIGRNAYDDIDVALFAAEHIAALYPDALVKRYKLKALPDTPDGIMAAIGKARGCLMPGGLVDEQKVAELLITDFRTGNLGRLTLEKPGEDKGPLLEDEPDTDEEAEAS